eukprot:11220347-Lingulodinium_polyedra.AAC.1
MELLGLPTALIYALAKELVFNTFETTFMGLRLDEVYEYNKAIRTGGKEGPWLWNVVLRTALAPAVSSWKAKEFGVM